MKKHWVLFGICVYIFAHVDLGMPLDAAAGEDDGEWVSKVISIQGRVLARRQGADDWQRLHLDDILFAGDQVRVGANSRAGIMLSNDAVLRLDQNTTLVLTEIEQETTFIFRLIKGAANFFSHRPRSLKIVTPFVNGVVEGTEFLVRVDADQTRIDLFEGRILAQNSYGEVQLVKGQGVIAAAGGAPERQILVSPRDSVQWALYYPPVMPYRSDEGQPADEGSPALRSSYELYRQGRSSEAIDNLASAMAHDRDARFWVYRAGLLLNVGRVTEALADIRKALVLDPENGDALALQAIIDVVQNRKADAIQAAQKAVRSAPRSSTAYIAMSYALQAEFKLQEALQAAQHAVDLAPGNGTARARLAELRLSVGELDKGIRAAQKAAELDPHSAHAHTILGFAYLTRIKTKQARQAFNQAIALDSAAPLPRLGLGLARIRDGRLEQGRSQIEIAVGLDPANALLRSYLGKAYFDEKRGPMDEQQLDIAKTLDPNDPTPWFYDAIRKQTLNRPVEALHDLQKSIELNDNRAVYRSRLMLDEDVAARSASLGRIYNDLGFQELALRQGWRSLNMNQANYSAHRLLADTYSSRRQYQIARVSELLQSKLLQPLNMTPIQPQLDETYALANEDVGFAGGTYQEYDYLFPENHFSARANGFAGTNATLGDEIAFSTVYDKFAFSIGQFYYKTEGFRENNDYSQMINNAFIQTAITPEINFQVEYRQKSTESGDLNSAWYLFDPDTVYRNQEDTDTWRAGVHIKPSSRSDIITSFIHQKMKIDELLYFDWDPDCVFISKGDGFIEEIQYLYHGIDASWIIGGGHYDFNTNYIYDVYATFDTDVMHDNGYFYTHLHYPSNITWTIGASIDYLHDEDLENPEQFSPKFGFNWQLSPGTTLRAAGFKVLKRSLIADQSIEPTQIAGFNQFFDDWDGTETYVYAVGIDHSFSETLTGGLEAIKRDLKKPMAYATRVVEEDWHENTFRAHMSWAMSHNIALSFKYSLEQFERKGDNPNESAPVKMETQIIPILLGYFNPWGFSGKLRVSNVHQKVNFYYQPDETEEDNFTITDLAIACRFPGRFGTLSAEIKNMFDHSFNYMGMAARSPQLNCFPDFVPERTFLIRLSIVF